MTRNTKIAVGAGGVVVAAVVYTVGQLMTFQAEPPPEFEIAVETSAPNAVAYLNGKTVPLTKSGSKWVAERNDIGARDSVTRVVEIQGISDTAYKIELKHHGNVVDSESGDTDDERFRSPRTGVKVIRLQRVVINDE